MINVPKEAVDAVVDEAIRRIDEKWKAKTLSGCVSRTHQNIVAMCINTLKGMKNGNEEQRNPEGGEAAYQHKTALLHLLCDS